DREAERVRRLMARDARAAVLAERREEWLARGLDRAGGAQDPEPARGVRIARFGWQRAALARRPPAAPIVRAARDAGREHGGRADDAERERGTATANERRARHAWTPGPACHGGSRHA